MTQGYHGKATRVYCNGYDYSAYLNSISPSMECDTIESTVFGSSAKAYVVGTAGASISAAGIFGGSTSLVEYDMHNGLASAENVWSVWPISSALGYRGFGAQTINNSYSIDSPADGVVSVAIEGQSNVGRDSILSHHALQAESTSGSETSIDNTAATTKGGVGYVQVMSNSTGTLTCKVQHSSAGTSWADLISFTATTGVTAERKTVAGAVKRYTKAQWTFSSATTAKTATFNIGFGRK